MAHWQPYEQNGDISLTDWKTQVDKIAALTKFLELQLERAKMQGNTYKNIEGMPQGLTWVTLMERVCQVFSPVATKCMLLPEYFLGMK